MAFDEKVSVFGSVDQLEMLLLEGLKGNTLHSLGQTTKGSKDTRSFGKRFFIEAVKLPQKTKVNNHPSFLLYKNRLGLCPLDSELVALSRLVETPWTVTRYSAGASFKAP